MSAFSVERRGSILIVRLDRPDRLNALDPESNAQLSDLFDSFETSPDERVAIITASGSRAFCSGNDLKAQARTGRLERPATGFAGLTCRTGRTKPVIAAVNGWAAGGGAEIVASVDLAVAEEHAQFSFPEVRVGLVPSVGIHRLVRGLGRKDAAVLLLTGRPISAAEALRIGLINAVMPTGEALTAALSWAEAVVECSPAAIRVTMQMMQRSARTIDLDVAFAGDVDDLAQHRRHPDFREGPLAFAEKRLPLWAVETQVPAGLDGNDRQIPGKDS